MLRYLSRLRAGDTSLSAEKRRALIRWLTDLTERGLVVAYDPDAPPNEASDTGGWYYVPWQPGDATYIRPPDYAPPDVYDDRAERNIWARPNLSPDERRRAIARLQRKRSGRKIPSLVMEESS
jgi:hypothetical protein